MPSISVVVAETTLSFIGISSSAASHHNLATFDMLVSIFTSADHDCSEIDMIHSTRMVFRSWLLVSQVSGYLPEPTTPRRYTTFTGRYHCYFTGTSSSTLHIWHQSRCGDLSCRRTIAGRADLFRITPYLILPRGALMVSRRRSRLVLSCRS